MATFGSRKFEEQCIRAYIKDNYCKLGDKCSLEIHPPKISSNPEDRICPACHSIFAHRKDEIKALMERAQEDTVKALIKASCRIGSCKTSAYDCGVCGPRERNLKKTTRDYFDLQKAACDAYLLRVYGVPRTGQGYEDERLAETKAAFWANWRPFVGSDGKFECNYPALYLRMVREDAPELRSIIFPYSVVPQSPQPNGIGPRRLSQNLLTNTKEVSETLVNGAKDVSENLISGAKDGAHIIREETSLFFKKDGPLRHTSSVLSRKTESLIRKGSDKVKSLVPSDDQFRSRRLGRWGSQLSSTMKDGKGMLREVGGSLKEKYESYKLQAKEVRRSV